MKMTAMERAKAAERASFLLPRESPRPRRPKTKQAVGIANFLCHSTAKRFHSRGGLALLLPLVDLRLQLAERHLPVALGQRDLREELVEGEVEPEGHEP